MIRKNPPRINAFCGVCAAHNNAFMQVATKSDLRTIRLLAGVCPPFPGWLRAGQSNLFGPDFLAQSALVQIVYPDLPVSDMTLCHAFCTIALVPDIDGNNG
jgi:hypothetical protein